MLLVCYHKKILIYPNVVELATAFRIQVEKKSSRQAGSGAMWYKKKWTYLCTCVDIVCVYKILQVGYLKCLIVVQVQVPVMIGHSRLDRRV
jgi:hypothetical protein